MAVTVSNFDLYVILRPSSINNDTNERGKLAVVTKITLHDGIYHGLTDHGIIYAPGSAAYGTSTVASTSDLQPSHSGPAIAAGEELSND